MEHTNCLRKKYMRDKSIYDIDSEENGWFSESNKNRIS